MSKGLSLFLRLFFGAMLVVAVLIFAGLIPKPEGDPESGDEVKNVVLWGTFPERQMTKILTAAYDPKAVTYVEKDVETFDAELVEALAVGQGPDLILIPQELIIKRQDSLQLIPFEVLSERAFRDTYLSQGEIYLREDGILALPFYIDPMVMYWNRDIFAQKGVVRPPRYWDEIYELTPVLTERTEDNSIVKSAVSFGEYQNVTHAKDLISMLILQTGNPIIRASSEGFTATLSGNTSGILPATSVMNFFTNFSDPRQEEYYTWNRGLPEAKDMFINQNLGLYFGYASEYFDMQRRNPLLNFDVAKVPQIRDGEIEATIGKIFGVGILAQSSNKQDAYSVALTLAGPEFSQKLSQETFLPPVQRALYESRPTDAFRTVFYSSAIISRGWRDPAPDETRRIFREAVEKITSGESSPSQAVGTMNSEIQLVLDQTLSLTAVTNRIAESI